MRNADFDMDVTMSRTRNRGPSWKVMIALFTIICLLGVGVFVLVSQNSTHKRTIDELTATIQHLQDTLNHMPNPSTIEVTPEIHVSIASLKELVAPTGKLTSCEYYYTISATFDKQSHFFSTSVAVPFSKDTVIYTQSGVIGAGVNLPEVNFDVDENAKQVTITMPSATIISHTVDTATVQRVNEAKIYPATDQEYEDFRSQMRADREKVVLENKDFWKNTRNNAEATVTRLLRVSPDLNEYELVYVWPSDSL